MSQHTCIHELAGTHARTRSLCLAQGQILSLPSLGGGKDMVSAFEASVQCCHVCLCFLYVCCVLCVFVCVVLVCVCDTVQCCHCACVYVVCVSVCGYLIVNCVYLFLFLCLGLSASVLFFLLVCPSV